MTQLLLMGPAPLLLLPAPPPVKLDWNYDHTHDCEVAFHNGYMIKAERDESPGNPFEENDCNWPIHVYAGRDGSWSYPKDAGLLSDLIGVFNDGQLVHDQIAIAEALGTTIHELMTAFSHLGHDDLVPAKYCHDAEFLRVAFEGEWENVDEGRKSMETAAELWNLSGVPAYCGETRGYSQGDWAVVLVVATPAERERLGCSDAWMRERAIEELCLLTDVQAPGEGETVIEAKIRGFWEKDFENTIDLYGHWAWGNVYGYTLWAPTFDEDGEIEDWEQLDDSCWGYYGPDHAESGLEEAALGALPDEPVRVPDVIQYEEAA